MWKIRETTKIQTDKTTGKMTLVGSVDVSGTVAVDQMMTAKPGITSAPSATVNVSSITVKGISKKIAAGKKVSLTAQIMPVNATDKSLNWTSSNTKYATVTSTGVVKAKKAGKGKSVKITARATDGSNKKKTITIKIK